MPDQILDQPSESVQQPAPEQCKEEPMDETEPEQKHYTAVIPVQLEEKPEVNKDVIKPELMAADATSMLNAF